MQVWHGAVPAVQESSDSTPQNRQPDWSKLYRRWRFEADAVGGKTYRSVVMTRELQ